MSAILFGTEVNFSLKHIIQGKTAQRNQFLLSLSNRLSLFVWGRRVFGGLLGIFEVTCPLKGRLANVCSVNMLSAHLSLCRDLGPSRFQLPTPKDGEMQTNLFELKEQRAQLASLTRLISTSPTTATGCEPFLLGRRARVFDRVPTPFGILASPGMNEIVNSCPLLLLVRPGWIFWGRPATSKPPPSSMFTSCL